MIGLRGTEVIEQKHENHQNEQHNRGMSFMVPDLVY